MRERKIFFLPIGAKFPYPNIELTAFEYKRLAYFSPRRVLLDVGIGDIFFERKYTDYPQWFIDFYTYIVKELARKYEENLYPIIPDYPPAWIEGQRQLDYEKGIEMIKLFKKFDYALWLPVIQWDGISIGSIEKSIRLYSPYVDEFERLATTLQAKKENASIGGIAVHEVRRHFPLKHIHVLGLTLRHKKYVSRFDFDSFDTVTVLPRKGKRYYGKIFGDRQTFYVANVIRKLGEAYGPLEE